MRPAPSFGVAQNCRAIIRSARFRRRPQGKEISLLCKYLQSSLPKRGKVGSQSTYGQCRLAPSLRERDKISKGPICWEKELLPVFVLTNAAPTKTVGPAPDYLRYITDPHPLSRGTDLLTRGVRSICVSRAGAMSFLLCLVPSCTAACARFTARGDGRRAHTGLCIPTCRSRGNASHPGLRETY